jgi:hypothetical protein
MPANSLVAGTQQIASSRPALLGRSPLGDYPIAAAFVGLICLVLIWRNKAATHWFLLPVAVCGVLTGVDIVRWLRGRLDLFDPQTLIACLAFHGFFVAPLLHVLWDMFGVGDLVLFGDTRQWLGLMSCLNAAGLVGYRLAHKWSFGVTRPSSTIWRINRNRSYPLFTLALALSAVGLGTFLWQLQGVSGLIEAYEENQVAFVGKGWLLVFAWPFAVLSFIVLVFTLTDHQRKLRHHLTSGMLLLSVAGIGHFLLLGWYGSRVATVSALFWMAGILHYRFRKLPSTMMAVGVIILLGFAYFYGFYKERGRPGWEVLRAPAMWLNPAGYQRDLKYLLLDDLARVDSNALILHNLMKDPNGYQYRWGQTYLGALTILIPRYFWTDRPYFRVDAGTEALWGRSAQTNSNRLYGLAGEALLNFGPFGVVPIFVLYGVLLGWYRRNLESWDAQDARLFLAPFFTSMFVEGLVCDSDVLVFFAATQGALICFFVFAASDGIVLRRSLDGRIGDKATRRATVLQSRTSI